MAVDIVPVKCPQCGSGDVLMISDTRCVCRVCETLFTIQPRIETQNVYNEVHVHEEPKEEKPAVDFQYYTLVPEHSEKDFLRSAWISLAQDDVPVEVFQNDFQAVSLVEHEVMKENLHADADYQAAVGYERKEPYIDFETYYEQEPYVDYEVYYENGIKKQKPVTKYRRVEKQRQVTKYRTVVDWRPMSGRNGSESQAIVENKPDLELDAKRFEEDFAAAKQSSLVELSADEAEKMQMTDQAQNEALEMHKSNIQWSIQRSLPGDYYRDVSWNANFSNHTIALIKAPEYEAQICFEGKYYTKRAFSFGKMCVAGDKIPNEISPETVRSKMRHDFGIIKKNRLDAVDRNIAKATTGISVLTILLLAASIAVSILIRSVPIILAAFGAAVVFFILNTVAVRSAEKKEKKKANDEIEAEERRVNSETEHYTENYRKRQRQALNKKLNSLGYPSATDEELSMGGAGR